MEEDEFVAQYRAHVDDVWRFVRRRCDSATEADDATAEAFAVAWRRRDDLPDDDAALRLWLLGTARRVLANQRRSARRREGLGVRLAGVAAGAGPADPGDEAVRADDPLWPALVSLPEPAREVLIMRAWDGLAVSEIAALLGCSPNAASVRLTRARDALAEALGHHDRKDRGRRRTPDGPGPEMEGATDDRT